jgi:hypothetical protein
MLTLYIIHHDSIPTSQTTQFDSIRDNLFREMVVYIEHVTTIILILYVKSPPHNLAHQLHTSKKYKLPEEGEELRPKRVTVIISK